jgi:hypothetical protein
VLASAPRWTPAALVPASASRPALYADNDARMAAEVAALRGAFAPGSALLLTTREYRFHGFRHVMYYLPEQTTLQLVPDVFFAGTAGQTPYLTARGGRTFTAGPATLDLATLPGFTEASPLRAVVLVNAQDAGAFLDPSCAALARPLPVGPREVLPVIPLAPGRSVEARRGRLYCDVPR